MTNRFFALAFAALLLVPASNLCAQDRLPPIAPDEMTDAQKKAVADYQQMRNQKLEGPPWTLLLRAPEWVVPTLQMRMHVQLQPVLGQRLTEFAILYVAREWNSFEFNAHARTAPTVGVSMDTIAALAERRRPANMTEEEEIVYAFCSELQHNKGVSETTYARAVAKFGEQGVVELASLQGFYMYLSMIQNAAGNKPELVAFPKQAPQ